MPINVPFYQPRIPISGGGGVVDLSAKENQSQRLIAQAIGELVGNIGRKPKQEQVRGIVVRGETSIKLINPIDGSEIADLGPPPKGDKANKALDAIVAMGRMSTAIGEDIPEAELSTELGGAAIQAERQKLTGALGLEEYEQEIPGKESRLPFGWGDVPARTEKRYRKKVESKEMPPRPKEYPDAKWSEEYQMWTIIKNGRLMGVQ